MAARRAFREASRGGGGHGAARRGAAAHGLQLITFLLAGDKASAVRRGHIELESLMFRGATRGWTFHLDASTPHELDDAVIKDAAMGALASSYSAQGVQRAADSGRL